MNILWNIVEQKIKNHDVDEQWKDEVLWLSKKIIYHDPTSNYYFKGKKWTRYLISKEKSLFHGDKHKGLPIGNLTSQFFANVYLNEMDHFITKKLGFGRYIRYVDDFVILDENKVRLQEVIGEVKLFLENNLQLKLCTDKTQLKRVERGIDFLGYFIKPTHTLVRKKIVKRFKKKMFICNSKKDEVFDTKDISMIQSYLGHFKHAHSYNLRKRIIKKYLNSEFSRGSY